MNIVANTVEPMTSEVPSNELPHKNNSAADRRLADSSVFRASVELPVSAAEAFAWHERPGAFERLAPPWEDTKTLECDSGLAPGSRRVLRMKMGPVPVRWVAEHRDYEPGRKFTDVQIAGPFAAWEHEHLFTDQCPETCLHEDIVRYRLPGGTMGRVLAGSSVEEKLSRVFAYRHETVAGDLATHQRYAHAPRQQVAISGSSGLVGGALAAFLATGGHQVTRLVRESSQGMPGFEKTAAWDPQSGQLDAAALEGVTAVVHLAGESIAAGRWTEAKKEHIRSSRVEVTRKLCESLARLAAPPEVLVCASAIGYYGDRAEERLEETSPAGEGFLAEVCQEWEQATAPATEAGIRVVHARLGIVLSPRDGALAKMLTPFLLGGGGRIGSGRQWWSWVALEDVLGAINHAILTPELSGAMNVVAPHPLRNAEFTQVLGRVLKRPTLLPMPAAAARLALGEMAEELLLASAQVAPRKLLESGYTFRYPQLELALRYMLGRK